MQENPTLLPIPNAAAWILFLIMRTPVINSNIDTGVLHFPTSVKFTEICLNNKKKMLLLFPFNVL
jgi:hypothetical protein